MLRPYESTVRSFGFGRRGQLLAEFMLYLMRSACMPTLSVMEFSFSPVVNECAFSKSLLQVFQSANDLFVYLAFEFLRLHEICFINPKVAMQTLPNDFSEIRTQTWEGGSRQSLGRLELCVLWRAFYNVCRKSHV